MIEESKKLEFWNYLTGEKNQPRPKGITMQRLAVIKPSALAAPHLWDDVIVRHGAESLSAREFYQSADAAATHSRANFWGAVRELIQQGEMARTVHRSDKSFPARREPESRKPSGAVDRRGGAKQKKASRSR